MARPTKLSPEVQERIVMAVRAGATREVAAALVPVNVRTLYRWLSNGHKHENGLQSQLSQAIEKAEAEFEAEAILRVRQSSIGGEIIARKTTTRKDGAIVVEETYTRPEWTAAAWLLERKYPDRWGRRERIDLRVLREEAKRMAEELGLDEKAIVEAAEAIVKGREH